VQKVIPFLVLVFLGSCSVELFSQNYNPYARDLVNITKFFEGEFDNDAQLWFQDRRDWPGDESEKHNRIHAIHTKIIAPNIGKHVFYVEEYKDGNSNDIKGQRIVNFKVDVAAGGIRMKIFFLKDKRSIVDGKDAVGAYENLTSDDLVSTDGCDIIFKREGDQFVGHIGNKTCQFGEGDETRYSKYKIILSEKKYWRVDQTYFLANDKFHMGHPTDVPYKMRKATPYKCSVGFYEKGYYSGSENDKRYENIIIHNQGGMEYFENPMDKKVYGLQLREKEYPFYTEGSDFFMMRFIEKDQTRSTVIVTAEPNAKRLSFSLGWASGSCEIVEQ